MYLFGKGWKRTLPYLGLLPGIALFVLFYLLPSLSTAFFSLTDISGVPNTPWHFIGLANYHEFFFLGSARDNLAALERTLIFSIVVAFVQNGIALALAVLLNTRLRGHTFYRAAIFVPVILGVTVVGLMWSLVLSPIGGPAENLANLFHRNSSFLGDYNLAFPLVIGIQIWTYVGYSMVIFLAGLQTIPVELGEAAVVDGAKPWTRFQRITFPLLAPSVTVNLLLSLIGSMQTYQLIYVLTGGQFNTSTLGMQIFLVGFGQNTSGSLRQGYASSLSMLQFVLVLVISMAFLFYLRRREVQL